MKKITHNILLAIILIFLLFNILILFNIIQIETRFYGIIVIIFVILNLIYFKTKDRHKQIMSVFFYFLNSSFSIGLTFYFFFEGAHISESIPKS